MATSNMYRKFRKSGYVVFEICQRTDIRTNIQTHIIITSSHYMEKTEAGLKGLCIREIVTK